MPCHDIISATMVADDDSHGDGGETMTAAVRGGERAARRDGVPGPRATWRQELVTVVLGTWLMVGLFVDGWAHSTRAELETFFTPWHALFYSGFAATAAWMGWIVHSRQERGARGRAAVPLGYGIGLLGVGVFAVGGGMDLVWHTLLGIEQDIEALFSPPHLLLFIGIVAILSSPLRAAWLDDPLGDAPRYRAFLPALLSATLSATLVAFMFMFLSAFDGNGTAHGVVAWAARQRIDGGTLEGFLRIEAIAGIMATNLLLVAPLLLLARRWVLPFGAATTLFTVHAILLSAIMEFRTPFKIGGAIAAGLVVDGLVKLLRVRPWEPRTVWALGVVTPLVVWSSFFLGVSVWQGLGWDLVMWSGTIMWASLIGGFLAVLMAPPTPVPATDEAD